MTTATPARPEAAPAPAEAAATPSAAAPETPAPAMAPAPSARDFLDWLVTPHLAGNRIIAAGQVRGGARVADALAGGRPAFAIYRQASRRQESRGGQLRELVALIVPPRTDGRPWPGMLESGEQVIVAEEYALSDTGFIICADLGRMLSDEERHRLAVWGSAPDGMRQVLAEADIGRYIHRRLPQISLGTQLRRGLAAVSGRLLRMSKLAGIIILAIIVTGLATVGAIVLIDPELMGLEIIDNLGNAKWLFSWLPWH